MIPMPKAARMAKRIIINLFLLYKYRNNMNSKNDKYQIFKKLKRIKEFLKKLFNPFESI